MRERTPSSRLIYDRRAVLAGLLATAAAPAWGRDFAFLPLSDETVRLRWWTALTANNSWAGGEPSAKLPAVNDWRAVAERIDSEIDAWGWVWGTPYPSSLAEPGQPLNCTAASLWKMKRLIDAGFPAGDARVLILQRINSDEPDHAALLLRFREGDFVLDNDAPGSLSGLHHWSKLRRRPAMVTEGKDKGRAAATWYGVWDPE